MLQIPTFQRKAVGFALKWIKGILIAFALLLFSCEEEIQPDPLPDLQAEGLSEVRGGPFTIVKPGRSIQKTVDNASAGDIILILPGLYREAITVNTPKLTLIGSGKVVIENPGEEENGITVQANGDGFRLYNVTLRNFESNGVFMIRADDYVLSYVTTVNCGDYGLFPLLSNHGRIEYCVAKGHTDSGIYIGLSEDTELRFNKTYENVIGLEIENCTRVVAQHNSSYNNTAGILVVLLPGFSVTSASDILLRYNRVVDNNLPNFSVPGGGFENFVPTGAGILVVGTDNTTLERNLVMNNNFLGIAVASTRLLGGLAGLPPEAFDLIDPDPDGTRIRYNVVLKNGASPPTLPLPIPGVDLFWDGSGSNNCWYGNQYDTSYPASLPSCQGI
ncbi:parallel beta-helix domain-containing protein [Sabulibacter ruber]|uniref:parallel beta-helix domain-containing protein n=1 Tax=Sabulibacter ruber TaxID=2811901 RepID=UPI001A96A89D|nr:parallel beta-helix domain-containing protein [Sabulibacter ruber]